MKRQNWCHSFYKCYDIFFYIRDGHPIIGKSCIKSQFIVSDLEIAIGHGGEPKSTIYDNLYDNPSAGLISP